MALKPKAGPALRESGGSQEKPTLDSSFKAPSLVVLAVASRHMCLEVMPGAFIQRAGNWAVAGLNVDPWTAKGSAACHDTAVGPALAGARVPDTTNLEEGRCPSEAAHRVAHKLASIGASQSSCFSFVVEDLLLPTFRRHEFGHLRLRFEAFDLETFLRRVC